MTDTMDDRNGGHSVVTLLNNLSCLTINKINLKGNLKKIKTHHFQAQVSFRILVEKKKIYAENDTILIRKYNICINLLGKLRD